MQTWFNSVTCVISESLMCLIAYYYFLLALLNFAKSDIHTIFIMYFQKKKNMNKLTWIDKFMGMEIYLLIKIANKILNWIGRHKCYFTSISYTAIAAVWST